MPLTIGDLLIIELALAQYLKGIDLSMMAGQQVAGIIGKVEYQIGQLSQAAEKQIGPGLNAPEK